MNAETPNPAREDGVKLGALFGGAESRNALETS